MPSDQIFEATSPVGAVGTYTPPTATDNIDQDPTVDCILPSGSTFPLGPNTVTCTATDDAGNQISAQFTITVRDTTPPTIAAHDDETAEATGPNGATDRRAAGD